MEKYHDEIVQTLVDSYKDDKELLGKIMYSLYHATNDFELKELIVGVLNDLDVCIQCGSKLTGYTFEETHTELDNRNVEVFVAKLCNICDRAEITELNATRKEDK